jgi:spore coat protein YsxE
MVSEECFLTSFYVKGVSFLNRPLLELYRPVLQQYYLQPNHIDDYGKVKKVYTNAGTFALKEVNNPEHIQAIEQAYSFYKQQIVPIYLSRHGTPFVFYNGRYYYLMPWIVQKTEEEERESILSFFRDLARLHRKSLQEIEVTEDNITKYYETRKNEWEKQRSFLQSYIEQCENEWYMSPFQLQFCTYFHETMQAYWFAETQLEKWYEKIKETKKWRIAFIHGNASLSHYVYDEKGNRYFLSWERACWASPLADLFTSLYHHVRTSPPIGDEWIDGFVEYEQQLSILDEERAFFFSHLAQPDGMYRFVSQYATERQKERSERDYVSRLQRRYWTMKNIEYIVMRLVQMTEAKQSEEQSEVSS